MKKKINNLISFFLKIKIIKIFSHYNLIVVIQNICSGYFIKISFSKYCNLLLKNEKEGYLWYSNLANSNISIRLKNYIFFTVLKNKKVKGYKISYNKSIILNKKFILEVIKHYQNYWPKSKVVPSHGDLTFDNILFSKNRIFFIDWEFYKKKGEAWGFDIVYFLLSALILPNINKKNISIEEKKLFLKLWKKIKKKIVSKKLKKNPLSFFEKKISKDSHWNYLVKKNPNKLFINKMSDCLKRNVNDLFNNIDIK